MTEQSEPKQISTINRTFISLTYPNFRFWFIGQMISLFGTWTQTTAIGFYGFMLTRSEAFLGYLSFAAGVPSIILMLFGGVAADIIPRRNLIIMAQSLMMVMAFLLSILTFCHITQPWHLVVIAITNGIANAFDAPARQAFVLEMVDRSVLTNAIALNSSIFNIATAVGPALGGIAYALFGPAWCFLLNGISFLAVIGALLMMKLKPVKKPEHTVSALKNMQQGFSYVKQTPFIQVILLIVASVTLLGFSLFTLFPAWAVTILHGDSRTNGFLLTSRGIGSFIAAIIIAFIGETGHRKTLFRTGLIAFPCFMIVFAFISVQMVSFFLVFLTGLSQVFIFNLANAFVQNSLQDEFRGRVMSIYTLNFFGTLPFGSLFTGVLAESIGSVPVIAGSSVILLGFAVILLRFSKIIKYL